MHHRNQLASPNIYSNADKNPLGLHNYFMISRSKDTNRTTRNRSVSSPLLLGLHIVNTFTLLSWIYYRSSISVLTWYSDTTDSEVNRSFYTNYWYLSSPIVCPYRKIRHTHAEYPCLFTGVCIGTYVPSYTNVEGHERQHTQMWNKRVSSINPCVDYL